MSLLRVCYRPALKLYQSNSQSSLMHRDYYYHPHFIGKSSGTEVKTAFEKAYPCNRVQGCLEQKESKGGDTRISIIWMPAEDLTRTCYKARTVSFALLIENGAKRGPSVCNIKNITQKFWENF